MNTLHLHNMNIRYRLIMNICHLLNKASIQQRTSHVNSKSIRSSGGSLEKIECMKSYVESTYLSLLSMHFRDEVQINSKRSNRSNPKLSGYQSFNCQNYLNIRNPPPPHVRLGLRFQILPSRVYKQSGH